jgi:hypothetical protein
MCIFRRPFQPEHSPLKPERIVKKHANVIFHACLELGATVEPIVNIAFLIPINRGLGIRLLGDVDWGLGVARHNFRVYGRGDSLKSLPDVTLEC